VSFVLDSDICSAYIRGEHRVYTRFEQYWGGLYISAITAGELNVWAHRASTTPRITLGVEKLLATIPVLPVTDEEARAFGRLRARLLDQGVVVPVTDLFIAVSAELNDFTVVTHNRKHFGLIPGIRIQDWTIE